ncbi:hypothetical protein KKF81_05355 [Candidatus Micrarchaeota archaeon]|nr:hypothetical protein [Candidatus Micrarchaeota archaeon]MBU1166354.1 hypothetical protein [Candidatus Micrarchaeota archaeon]MBU1886241.1 hypothetical protein [Candidatus Micrarchaeota archaeon]
MFKSLLFGILFCGLFFATVPSWIQPGVTVTYDGYAAEVNANGDYENAVQTVVVMTVQSVSGNTVSGNTRISIPSVPSFVKNYPWTCTDGTICDWRFWVDPTDPVGSIKGPNGETLSIVGTGPYSYGSYQTNSATMLLYQNQQTKAEYHITADSRTGLIIAYAEKYPNQEIYLYVKSVNVDLSNYQPPQQTQTQAQQSGTQGFNPLQDPANDPLRLPCASAFILSALFVFSIFFFRRISYS